MQQHVRHMYDIWPLLAKSKGSSWCSLKVMLPAGAPLPPPVPAPTLISLKNLIWPMGQSTVVSVYRQVILVYVHVDSIHNNTLKT